MGIGEELTYYCRLQQNITKFWNVQEIIVVTICIWHDFLDISQPALVAIFDTISPLSCQAFKYHVAVRVAERFDLVGYRHYCHLVFLEEKSTSVVVENINVGLGLISGSLNLTNNAFAINFSFCAHKPKLYGLLIAQEINLQILKFQFSLNSFI